MAARLAKHRVVAFIVYENIVRDAGHGVKLRVTGDACHDDYLRVGGWVGRMGEAERGWVG